MDTIHTDTWTLCTQTHGHYTHIYMNTIHTDTWTLYTQIHEHYARRYTDIIHTAGNPDIDSVHTDT